jgi:hypothetical protein
MNYKGGVHNRRIRALARLQEQLKSGMKPGKRPVRGINIALDDADIKRIQKEINSLKSKI